MSERSSPTNEGKGRATPFVLGILRGFGIGTGLPFPDGQRAEVADGVASAVADELRLRIAREWLASYDDVRHPDYAFADGLLKQRGLHEGDCPLADHPIPMTCSACVVEDALAFADRALGNAAAKPAE
jgi:hypothetical protein